MGRGRAADPEEIVRALRRLGLSPWQWVNSVDRDINPRGICARSTAWAFLKGTNRDPLIRDKLAASLRIKFSEIEKIEDATTCTDGSRASRPDNEIDFDHTSDVGQLQTVLAAQDYTYARTKKLRLRVREAREANKLLNLMMSLVVDFWHAQPKIAGVAATLLSANLDRWIPKKTMLPKLRTLCSDALRRGELEMVASIEPLAFTVASHNGYPVHQRYLQLVLEEPAWRVADAARIEKYYGSLAVEIESYERHWEVVPWPVEMREAALGMC